MLNKLKIVGVKNLPTEAVIEENKDYLISIKASLDGTFSPTKHGEEAAPTTFHLRATSVEQILPIGEKEAIKFEQGKSPSQKLRYAIEAWAVRRRVDDVEAFYEFQMKKLAEKVNNQDR